jgi:membrane protease YdiL (CAAX protease family)
MILDGIAQVPGMYLKSPVPIIIGSIVLSALVVLAYYGWIGLTEGHKATDLSIGRLLPETCKGLLTGFLYFVVVVGIMMLAGVYRVESFQFNGLTQLAQFCFFLTIAVGEEVMFRGIVFRMIDVRWNTWIALLVSTAVFGLVHIVNPGATWWSTLAIALESGLLLGAAYKWSGTLWLPIGIHWAWNFTQGNIYGAAVSGTEAGDSVLVINAYGPDIVTGGAFGPEASIVAVIFGIIITLVFLGCRYRQ